MRDVATADKYEAETSGVTEVHSFSIAASGKAFKILINGLYSDKPRAIVRELWSNAFDSHVLAGIADRPFQCRLPTRWDHTFSVRDFGVSLTHEKVIGLYTTVFQSTKEDSNTQVGKFGLGSKVPFAYTDAFTLTAILNGEKRIYNAFIDRDGVPKIALFATQETDEEQGLEVSFPVKEQDINAFTVAAKRVALGFDVLPNNNIDLEKTEFNTVLEGEGWKIVRSDHNTGLHGAFVRQGCVLYPVDRAALNSHRQSTAVSQLSGETIILDTPIGTVDITPSRESLSYDDITCDNLIASFEAIVDAVTTKISDAISEASTLFEAVRVRNSLLQTLTTGGLRNLVENRTAWRGRKVSASVYIDGDALRSLRNRGVQIKKGIYERNNQYSRRSKQVLQLKEVANFSVAPGALPTFYYIEDATQHIKHLARRLEGVNSSNAYFLVGFKPGGVQEKFLRVALGRPDEALTFKNFLDVPFTKPDYQRSFVALKVWSLNEFVDNSDDEIVDDDDVFYVHLFKGEPRESVDTPVFALHQLRNTWDALKKFKLIPQTARLVGIPASRKDISKGIPEQWEAFLDAAREIVTSSFDPVKASKARASETLSNHGGEVSAWLGFFAHLFGEGAPAITDPSSTLVQVATEVRPYLVGVSDGELHLALAGLIPNIVKDFTSILAAYDAKPYQVAFARTLARVKVTYPLITQIAKANSWHLTDKDFLPPLIDYIKLIDAREGDRRLENMLDASF